MGPLVRTVSNFNDRIQLHLICQMLILAKFSGVESERTISMFRKRKRKFLFCAPVLNEEVHIAVMRRRLGNVQKGVTHVRIVRFCAYKPIAFFAVLVAVAVVVA